MKSGPIPQAIISSSLLFEKQTMVRVAVVTGHFAIQSQCFYFTLSLMSSTVPSFFYLLWFIDTTPALK